MVLAFMKPFSFWRVLVLVMASALFSPLVSGQATLDKTTLGHSQNSSADLANSLVPGPKHFGKGEKKSEVDPKTLPSKTSHDTTFSGSLNDIGLDWGGDKMGKPRAVAEADSKSSAKQSESAAEKTSHPSKETGAAADKTVSKSTDAEGNARAKESKTTSAASGEKSPDKP